MVMGLAGMAGNALMNAAAPALGNAAANLFQAGVGNASANVATRGLNTGNVDSTYQRLKGELTPEQQGILANRLANEAATQQNQQLQQAQAFNAGLGNTAANLNTERNMMVNAQANAANNVANQLNQLGQARASNANLLGQAMNTASLFR